MNNKSNKTYMSISGKGAVQRIRAPTRFDVLLGRGGGINSHAGNQSFRGWVAERKEDYNLAGSKVEKTKVATEVMERVKDQGGRFLQRESGTTGMGSSTGWWVEVDFNRALAKTSQALREGAPKIRAAHQSELLPKRGKASKRKAHVLPAMIESTAAPASWPQTVPSNSTIAPKPALCSTQLPVTSLSRPLMSNSDFQRTYQPKNEPAFKRGRTLVDNNAETPPLLPTTQESSELPPLRLEVLPQNTSTRQLQNLPRTHSLAFSDISTPIEDEDFVNPFLDETNIFESQIYKQHSDSETSKPMVRNVSTENENLIDTTMETSSSLYTPTGEEHRSLVELYEFLPLSSSTARGSNSLPTQSNDDSNRGSVGRDFNEDVKQMWDIVQPDGDITSPNLEEEGEPTVSIPWRGGILKRRYGSLKRRTSDLQRKTSGSLKAQQSTVSQ